MTPTNQTPDVSRLTPNPASDFAWQINEATGGVAITRFLDKTATTCVVPAEIDGRPVTALANRAFEDRDKLQSVVVLSGAVWLVGYRAFSGCSSLTQVVLPPSVRTLGREAFQDCGALESIRLPDSLRVVRQDAFYGCRALRSIELPPNLQSVRERAFDGCVALHVVASPDGQATIPGVDCVRSTVDELRARTVDGVLFSADGKTLLALLESKIDYVVPDGVENIGARAFYNYEALQSVTFPDGLQTIGYCAFSECKSLKSVTFPDDLQTIGDWAFDSCESLESVTLPAGLQTIGNCAFRECKSLKSVTLPDGLQIIGDCVFDPASRWNR